MHLLGRWQSGFEAEFVALGRSLGLNPRACIFSYPPCHPEKIPGIAASFDVGLALELPVSRNREICLSNKIFTYLLAGICIVASESEGQKRFFENLPQVGFTFPCGNVDALTAALANLLGDRELLNQLSMQSEKQGREKYNWTVEGRKLLEFIDKQVLS